MYSNRHRHIHQNRPTPPSRKSHSSKTFAPLLFLSHLKCSLQVKNVLTDNGSKFFSKTLIKLLTENKITHYHTYPKTPKMNAHCELSAELFKRFVDYNVNLLDDTTAFNEKMKEYLIFYNHQESPLGFQKQNDAVCGLKRFKYYVSKLPAECKNGWGYAVG